MELGDEIPFGSILFVGAQEASEIAGLTTYKREINGLDEKIDSVETTAVSIQKEALSAHERAIVVGRDVYRVNRIEFYNQIQQVAQQAIEISQAKCDHAIQEAGHNRNRMIQTAGINRIYGSAKSGLFFSQVAELQQIIILNIGGIRELYPF